LIRCWYWELLNKILHCYYWAVSAFTTKALHKILAHAKFAWSSGEWSEFLGALNIDYSVFVTYCVKTIQRILLWMCWEMCFLQTLRACSSCWTQRWCSSNLWSTSDRDCDHFIGGQGKYIKLLFSISCSIKRLSFLIYCIMFCFYILFLKHYGTV